MVPTDLPASRAAGRILFATLIVCAASAVFGRELPAPLPAGADPREFSAARARAIVAEIARAPHPVRSDELARVRTCLLERLRASGFAPQTQHGEVDGIALDNLLVHIDGSAPTGTLLCLAHYDSVPRGPGAGDDSIGVASWIEALRALRAREWRPKNDVVLLLTDGEERGLLGAQLFVDEHPWMKSVACAVNLEAIGNGGPAVLFQLGEQNGACVQAYAASVAAPTGTSLGDAVYRRMPNDTDLTLFVEQHLAGFNLAITSGSAAYHSPHDTPENLDTRSLQHMGECALSLTEHLANADLRKLHAPDETFFDLLGRRLVHYPRAWDAVLAALGGALAWLALRTTRASARELARCALRHARDIALVAAGATCLWLLVDSSVAWLAPQTTWIPGNTTSGALLFLGALALAAWFELAIHHADDAPARAATVALLWSALALAAFRFLPGASFVFALPAICAILGILVARKETPARTVVLAASFAAALLLGLPILELLMQLFERVPAVALALITATLVSAAGLFALPFQRIARDVPWARRTLLAAGIFALVGSVVVARVLGWRQGALLP